MKPLIKFNSSVDGRSATLQIDGELDIATRDQLVEQLRQLEALAVDVICLDVADVSFIDCSCLGVLHRSNRRLCNRGRHLELAAASDCFLRVAELAGFGDLTALAPSVPMSRRSVC